MSFKKHFNIDEFCEQIKHPLFDKSNFIDFVTDKNYLLQNHIVNQHSKKLFHANITCHTNSLRNVFPNHALDLKSGQLVTFTNVHGVSFPNNEILGFDPHPADEHCVFLSGEAYWTTVSAESLTLQDCMIGLDQSDLDGITSEFEKSYLPCDSDLAVLR